LTTERKWRDFLEPLDKWLGVLRTPRTPDRLKLANAQLRFVDTQQDITARARIYPLLYIYLLVLIGYSVFLIVAIGLTAGGVWAIPWRTLTGMGAGNFGLGASSYFFRSPMNHLFPRGR
jgi:hypothetical protein